MIRITGEPDNTVTVEITQRALEHIKGTEHWYGFLKGVLAGAAFLVFVYLMR